MTDWLRVPVFGTRPDGERSIIRPSAYAIIANGRGQIVVVRTPRGLFLPGGGIDEGEEVEEAIRREVLEECGITVEVGAWQAHAVDHVYSPSECASFEKRSTFRNARSSTQQLSSREPDHAPSWTNAVLAASELAQPSHRWAIAEWSSSSDGAR